MKTQKDKPLDEKIYSQDKYAEGHNWLRVEDVRDAVLRILERIDEIEGEMMKGRTIRLREIKEIIKEEVGTLAEEKK